MSPEAWIVVLGVALAVLCYAAFELHRYVQRTDEAVERNKDRADAYCVAVEAMTAERDEALRQKAAQFEESQRERDKLRAYITDLQNRFDVERDARAAAEAELALLRPIADSAEKLLDDEKLPGEWADVRAAIRARKEAGNG